MNPKQKLILTALLTSSNLSGKELSKVINMSTRSVRSFVKELNLELRAYQAQISASTNNGYQLIINNEEVFLRFMQELSQEEAIDDLSDISYRLQYIFESLITSDDYLKIDDLCEDLYISRTQIKNSLKTLRAFFITHNLTLTQKPHFGLKLNGNEFQKRQCIAHFKDYLQNKASLSQSDLATMNKLSDIVYSCIQNTDYQMSDLIFQNLVSHLFIALNRIKCEQYVSLDKSIIKKQKSSNEYAIAQHIMTLMIQFFNIPYNESECAYISIHLSSKRIYSAYNNVIEDQMLTLVNELLEYIRVSNNIDLSKDFNLQMALCQHLVPLIKRIEYKTFLRNPLIHDIKEKFTFAYDVAFNMCSLINKIYHTSLSEDEIGYFALHINIAIENSKNETIKKNILIVCSSGVGSAKLLKFYFEEQFSKYINLLDVCNSFEIHHKNLEDYHLIFTTIPLTIDTTLPIIEIRHFLDNSDFKKIKKELLKISTNINNIHYFKRELFNPSLECIDDKDAISKICQNIKKHYPIPDEFEQSILEREKINTTTFNNIFAFPHPQKPLLNMTFVSVNILKHPILWGKCKIKAVILVSIEKGQMKNLDGLYKIITHLMTTPHYYKDLLQKPSFEKLVHIIEDVNNE